MRILVVIIVLLVTGCGYHVPGASDDWVGGKARTVYIRLFNNQTTEPFLENFVTDALIDELSRSRVIKLTENSSYAELTLSGNVESFTSNALAFNSSDRITEYRATMNISVRLTDKNNNQTIWQDKLRRSNDYLATVNKNLQLEGRRVSARQVAKRLAEDVHALLLVTK